MQKQLTFLLATVALVLSAFSLNAQINTPAASPSAMLKQTVGLTDVEIEYSRPSMKGRTIFAADGLVPFGSMWRTGANASSKISFSDDVTFGGVEVPAGKYAIYTIPDESAWTIVLYKDLSHWGVPREWDDSQEAARITVEAGRMANAMESFTISIDDLTTNSANVMIGWEKTMVKIPVVVDVDTKVMADIERAMGGTTAREYYAAASYYLENDKDLNQALEWIQAANDMEPRFWTVRREALILAEMGQYTEAIAAAERSKTMATEAGNTDYVRMNEKSIEEWSKMTNGTQPARKESKS
jgi:hypothetical protein